MPSTNVSRSDARSILTALAATGLKGVQSFRGGERVHTASNGPLASGLARAEAFFAAEKLGYTGSSLVLRAVSERPPSLVSATPLSQVSGPRLTVIKAIEEGRSLEGANLTGADLKGLDLSGMNLKGAVLRGADMTGCDLSNAQVTRADFSGALLYYANCAGMKGDNVKMVGTQVEGADFSQTRLMALDTGGADLLSKENDVVLDGSKIEASNHDMEPALSAEGPGGPSSFSQGR